MGNGKQGFKLLTCSYIASVFFVAVLCHSSSEPLAALAKTSSQPHDGTSISTPAPSTFDQCARTFFSPTLQKDLEDNGLTFTPFLLYAWVVDTVQRVIPMADYEYELTLKRAFPSFTENGWREFTAFLEETIVPFFRKTKSPLIQPLLMSAPNQTSAVGAQDSAGKRIGARVDYSVRFNFHYIQQAQNASDAKTEDKFFHVTVSVIQYSDEKKLKIDSWKFSETAEPR